MLPPARSHFSFVYWIAYPIKGLVCFIVTCFHSFLMVIGPILPGWGLCVSRVPKVEEKKADTSSASTKCWPCEKVTDKIQSHTAASSVNENIYMQEINQRRRRTYFLNDDLIRTQGANREAQGITTKESSIR
ncbi:predicted protein [Lichtheimia corymbifera JMRC:FSU:9682]|uniref:Uncharacterized protein n=1 Tax=Lichtheimia corymbifera JMRC:FSU:9682 TaxID=1263082 RepID=A0A068RZU4_9FUNG|nr:predicted protein [Lichtheimia corymbifera JMRC:FSU:9682]